MKKIAPIVAIAVIAAFSSCKKNYTCTCKDKSGNTTATYPYTKVKKSDAQKSCDALNSIAAASSGSCAL